MISIFNTILFNPLYNALVFLSGVMPGNDIGLAIIVLTLIVKVILLPIYHQSIKAQLKIKELEPELKKIKEKYKEDRQEQAKQTMDLYKLYNINPFSAIILLFLQLPIVLALFWVFIRGFELNLDILYSFVVAPEVINTSLLGLVNIAESSFFIALLVGFSQFIQMNLSLPPVPKKKKEFSFKDDFARSMNLQMRYMMPVIIVFIASTFPSAVAIYWLTSNLFA